MKYYFANKTLLAVRQAKKMPEKFPKQFLGFLVENESGLRTGNGSQQIGVPTVFPNFPGLPEIKKKREEKRSPGQPKDHQFKHFPILSDILDAPQQTQGGGEITSTTGSPLADNASPLTRSISLSLP